MEKAFYLTVVANIITSVVFLTPKTVHTYTSTVYTMALRYQVSNLSSSHGRIMYPGPGMSCFISVDASRRNIIGNNVVGIL